jgi:uncharacterized iron-regulated membrane protein
MRLHRWLGLTLGLIVALFGAAGAVLVWADEIESLLDPHSVTAAGTPDATPQWQAMLDQARTTAPWAAAWVINPARAPGAPAEVVAEPGTADRAVRLLTIDPGSGRLLGESGLTDTVVGTIFHFHTRLLSDAWGQPLVLALGAALLFFVVSGIVLWWPRRWSQALALRLDRGRTVALWDLHRVIGAVAALLLLLSIATGITLLYPTTAARAVDRVAGVPAPTLPLVVPGAVPLSLDALVARADAALPGGIVTRIIVPAASGPWTVRKQLPGEDHPNGLSFVRLDPYSGRLLQATPHDAASPGVAMFAWVYPLHIGLLGGLAHKLLLTLVGLVPSVLLCTGVWLWWRKRPRATPAAPMNALGPHT